MKNLILYSFLLALLTACADKDSYEITGTVPDSFTNEAVYLLKNKEDHSGYTIADSAAILNKEFKFNGKSFEPEVYGLSFHHPDQADYIYPVIIEPGKIQVSFSEDKEYMNSAGTPLNDKWNAISQTNRENAPTLNKLYESDELTSEEIRQFNDLRKKSSDLLYGFIKENINNKVGEYYFVSSCYLLDLQQADELLPLVNPKIRETRKIQGFEVMLTAEKNTKIGDRFTDVEGVSPDGKNIRLSDLVSDGKIVLLDFWASWCGPCMKDIPKVKSVYEKYKYKGFDVVGISIDQDSKAWNAAINKLGIEWGQISDLKGWDSEFEKQYPARPIPFTILLDGEGKIMAKGLRGNMLSATLDELLNEDK